MAANLTNSSNIFILSFEYKYMLYHKAVNRCGYMREVSDIFAVEMAIWLTENS